MHCLDSPCTLEVLFLSAPHYIVPLLGIPFAHIPGRSKPHLTLGTVDDMYSSCLVLLIAPDVGLCDDITRNIAPSKKKLFSKNMTYPLEQFMIELLNYHTF